MSSQDNVVSIRPQYALFNPELRGKLETSVEKFTDKPSETVTAVEHAISAHLVAGARNLGTRLGRALGDRLTRGFQQKTQTA